MRRWINWLTVASAISLCLHPSLALANGTPRAWMGENSNTFHGVLGDSSVAATFNVTCPPNNGNLDWIKEFFRGETNSGPFVEIGMEIEEGRNQQGNCYSIPLFNYSDFSLNGTTSTLTNIGGLIRPQTYSVNRLSNSNCQAGANWCWQFRLEGVTYDTCCHDNSNLNTVHKGEAGLRCHRDYGSSSACPNDDYGHDTQAGYQVKLSSNDNWVDWNGKDGWCISYDDGGRGDWIGDTSAEVAFNVVISQTKTDCPGL